MMWDNFIRNIIDYRMFFMLIITTMHRENESVIAALNNCVALCNHCFDACLKENDIKPLADCIALDRQCADVCSLTAGWLAAGHKFADRLKSLCADICNACAAECEKHEHNHCRECARACRDCAAACQ
jgi:hypothetical protein